jgi:hypothetical protein
VSNLAEFSDWKRHPITLVIMAEFQRRYNTLREQLVDQAASVSHEELCEKAGAAKAYRDVLSISVDELEESHGN